MGQWDGDLWSSAIKTSFSLNPPVPLTFVRRGDSWELLQGVALCCAAVDTCVMVYVHGWLPKVRLLPAWEFVLAVLLLGNTSVLVPWGD